MTLKNRKVRLERRYTKTLTGLADVSYSERLHKSQLCTLKLQRLKLDLHNVLSYNFYLRQVNEVNGGDNVFVRCVSVCVFVCVRAADR